MSKYPDAGHMECDRGGGRNTSTGKALQGKMNFSFLHMCLSLVQNLQEEIFSHWHYFSDSNEHLGIFFSFFLSILFCYKTQVFIFSPFLCKATHTYYTSRYFSITHN